MAREQGELVLHCSFADDGHERMEILLEGFRSFLYRETQKGAQF